MSKLAKLSGSMPADEKRNGLDSQIGQLINDPSTLRVAFVVYHTAKITTDIETGVKVPTVGVTRFEPICPLDKLPDDLAELILNAAAERTGQDALPLDTVSVVED